MAYHGIVIAGFGGQGVMLMGQIIAEAAVIEGKHSTWLPSYGPEMRGGTANCTVVVDERPVASPVIDSPTEVIAMNYPSMVKFGGRLQSGGILFVNSSVVDRDIERDDIEIIKVPVNEIAEEVGNPRVSNMVMLGAFVEVTGIVGTEAVKEALKHKLTGSKSALLELNFEAVRKGAEFVRRR